MKMIALLEKLETDAFLASRRKIEEDRLFAIQRRATPEARLEQSRKELRRLEAHTATMKSELKLQQQLKAEYQRHAEISLQLKEANLTLDERQQRDTEIQRQQLVFSRVCSEASPNWRTEATAAFNAKGVKR